MDLDRRSGGLAKPLYAHAILAEELAQFCGHLGCLLRGVDNSLQEELQPLLPCAFHAHLLQEFVVTVAMGLKVQAQVEQRLAEHSAFAEQEREQEPSQTPIAVEKWMDGFELHMHQS